MGKKFLDFVLSGHKKDQKTDSYTQKVHKILGDSDTPDSQQFRDLINEATARIELGTEDWDFVAARTLLAEIYQESKGNRGDFLDLINTLTNLKIYSPALLQKYTIGEIQYLAGKLNLDNDLLFTYAGLQVLSKRYITKDYDGNYLELPQERFLIIAMFLMQDEGDRRLEYVEELYWALSNLLATMATPTLANAGKDNCQLSSCFIDTVPDSLDGIYLNNWDSANVSKHGGGVGIYMGKVRGKNASIRGYKNVGGGIIPWMKGINATATGVDQLGVRAGAIVIYNDLWQWDLPEFLQVLTNNGDERLKTRDLEIGVCVPDYFMELTESDETGRLANPDALWYLFDPHDVRQTMGWSLEDCYDEQEGSGTWRTRYQQCIDHPTLRRRTIPAKEILQMLVVSEKETGMPYRFYRDEVNRQNANKHKGMIYCSNLCTEIAQNQSPSELVGSKIVDEDGEEYIYYKRRVGDYVVCNLASVNLAKAERMGVLRRVVRILVRALDNVISLNTLPLLQATSTNQKYRPIGLGTFGWHHALAVKGIDWDSEESVEYADDLYERVAFYAIEMSAELAEEKGAYKYFPGSEYHTGAYFDRKGYKTVEGGLDWDGLKARIMENGIRNGYWGAVAPNASTGLIAGSTQGIDAFYGDECIYYEEKKDFKIAVVAPDLNADTFKYYWKKGAHRVSMDYSIKQNAKRQRHIDQAVSFNIYIHKDIKAKDLLEIHRKAWRSKMKTTYYIRGTANIVEDCDYCQ